MIYLFIALLVLSAFMLCTPRGAESRAEIRAAARVAGWMTIAPTIRGLLVQALLLIVQALQVIHEVIKVAAQVAAIAAGRLEAAGTPKGAA